MRSGFMTQTRGDTPGRSTETGVVVGLRLGLPVLVRLDPHVQRPGTIIGIVPQPQGPATVMIRIQSFPGDHLCDAVRMDPHGYFLVAQDRETLWCNGAPRGTAVGQWEVL